MSKKKEVYSVQINTDTMTDILSTSKLYTDKENYFTNTEVQQTDIQQKVNEVLVLGLKYNRILAEQYNNKTVSIDIPIPLYEGIKEFCFYEVYKQGCLSKLPKGILNTFIIHMLKCGKSYYKKLLEDKKLLEVFKN